MQNVLRRHWILSFALPLAQQLRQLGDVRHDPPRIVAGHQLRRAASARLILEIDIRERQSVVIAQRAVIPTPALPPALTAEP